MRFRGPQPLSLVQQLQRLRATSLSTGSGNLRRGKLLWDFEARPTPLSRTYKVQIRYRCGGSPDAYVLEPHLPTLAGGRRLPHVFQQDPPRLCLYLPRNGEWSSSMRIAETIVPWSILWLYFFEDWLATDQWSGGGVHPKGRHVVE